MRVFERNQICEILATLYDGIEYASTAHSAEALPVLKDCETTISSVREAIKPRLSEKRAGFYDEHAAGVAAGLVKMIEGIQAGTDVSAEMEETLEQLRIIYNMLLEESEVKIEVAFFPYKASMWDALESVWIAAKDDSRCNVTVVPISYIDKTLDGSIIDMHCDHGIFPGYVPVTRFEDYNLEERAPDIAYIHNAYDKNNHVTSIDPEYYTSELKKHISLLVYVPYYVSGWKSAAQYAAVGSASSADVIVASSEMEAQNTLRFNREKDVVALGSPKVDRILRFEREKPDMPPEWREILKDKKVFLLSTSVSSLLQQTDKFIDKINHILDIFENRSDVALLWRPHPLSMAIIYSLRPRLYEGYTELLRRIQGFGVLDDTADITRAIALSDAYIGEIATSLLFMYALTGKPTFVLNFDIVKDITDMQRSEILMSANMWVPLLENSGKTALAISMDTNEICRIDLETGKVSALADIPGVGTDDMHPHIYIIDCGDKYILPPYNSDRFIELDRSFKLTKMIELPERAKTDLPFSSPVQYGDYVYFLPHWGTAFARYCVSTGEYEYFYDWYKDFEQYAEQDDPLIFATSHCIVGHKLYLPCYKDNIVAELNLRTMKMKVHRFGSSNNRYQSITHDGKYFWLTLRMPSHLDDSTWSDNIVRWDIKTGKVNVFDNFPEDFIRSGTNFIKIESCGDYILIFPINENKVLRINPKDGEISYFGDEIVETIDDEILPDSQSAVFNITGRFGNDSIYAIMHRERALLTVDVNTSEIKKVKLRFAAPHKAKERTELKWFMPVSYNRGLKGIYYERVLFTPEAFIDKVVSGCIAKSQEQAEFYLDRVANSDGTSGVRIHEYMMNKFIETEG